MKALPASYFTSRLTFFFVLTFSLGLTLASLASGTSTESSSQADTIPLKVGGTFVVDKISKRREGGFLIRFSDMAPIAETKIADSKSSDQNYSNQTGMSDIRTLELVSDHIHVGVSEGKEIRLSAEVDKIEGSIAQVSQMVIFLNGNGRTVPVWLLSSVHPPRDLRSTRYLKMHVPDFTIF